MILPLLLALAQSSALWAFPPQTVIDQFPKDLCPDIVALTDYQKRILEVYARELKHLKQGRLPEEKIIALVQKGTDNQLSSLELFSMDFMRSPCAILLDENSIAAMDKKFDLGLLMPLAGADKDGRPIKTLTIILGNGRVHVGYDREISGYRHPVYAEEFSYKSLVVGLVPKQGRMDISGVKGPWGASINGFEKLADRRTKVFLSHWLRGDFTREYPLDPIKPRSAAQSWRLLAPGRLNLPADFTLIPAFRQLLNSAAAAD